MIEYGEPTVDREADYHYRRPLTLLESLPAAGVGLAVGLAAFYVARLLLQRTPLVPQPDIPVPGPRGTIIRRPARQPARG